MASMLDKLGTLVKGKLHGLLNKAIDVNSMDVLAQYVREVEDACKEAGRALASARADVALANEDIQRFGALMAKADGEITQLLSDDDESNNSYVNPIQERFNRFQEDQELKRTELTGLQTAVAAVERTVSMLDDKKRQMLRQYRQLETAERTAAAQEKAASAIERAGAIDTSDVEDSVDNLTQRIRKRAAVAQERINMTVGAASDSPEAAVRKSVVDQQIAARRAAIAAQKAGKAGTAPTT